jgi:sulfate permease, SulP family
VSLPPPPTRAKSSRGDSLLPTVAGAQPLVGAAAALSVSVPHAVGLGLVAFAPLAGQLPVSSPALWSAAVPGALMVLLARSRGVVYAPSTAVALLFGGMLALVMQAGEASGITAGQALAMTGVFAALGFAFQGLMAALGLVRLAQFIPVSVTQGFAAGVGLTLVLNQVRQLLAAGGGHWDSALAWQCGLAAAVVALSYGLQRLWPRFPTLLLAVAVVVALFWWWLPAVPVAMATSPTQFLLPVFPDWADAPWAAVLGKYGFHLASLSLLMAVVNTLEVSVYHQQLEVEHGVRNPPAQVLGREAVVGLGCALLGMIPASTSTSRSRAALSYSQAITLRAGQWHAVGLLAVAASGHLWLHHVPLAVLVGALLVAGVRMIPEPMWRWRLGFQRTAARVQSWLVALVFAASGGAMALLAGLAVATVELLRDSGSHAIRRIHLAGRLRSRHVRAPATERWLGPQMARVAVVELQGIVSFGVAALVVDQVRAHLEGHDFLILDASRVPAWDETGCLRLKLLARELQSQDVTFALCGVRGWVADSMAGLPVHEDLDRALEWAEDQILQDGPVSPQALVSAGASPSALGDLALDLPEPARASLERLLLLHHFQPGDTVVRQGDTDRTLLLVQAGTVTLSTGATPSAGLRLSVIGTGAVFGEMGFLSGMPRTAFGHAGPEGCTLALLGWEQFQAWSQEYPQAALAFVTALARKGVHRLAATSQELRAAME